MDRRGFLRRFGIGAAVAVAAPSIAKAVVEPSVSQSAEEYHLSKAKELHDRHEWAKRRYPMRMDECYRSQWDDIAEREFFRPHWDELVRRYGNVNILDMLKLSQ